MNERLFTMGVMVVIFGVLSVCFDTDGRYLQQMGLFWAGIVFGALVMGGMSDEKY
jgi:hypothetical protein